MMECAPRGTDTVPRIEPGRRGAARYARIPTRRSRPRLVRGPWTRWCTGPRPATLAREGLRHLKLGVLPDAVAIGHARQVVSHAASQTVVAASGARRLPGQQLGVLDVVLEQPLDHRRDLLVLGAHRGPEVDPFEHELPQCFHRRPRLGSLDDVAGQRRVLDHVVYERVDPRRSASAENGYRMLGQL